MNVFHRVSKVPSPEYCSNTVRTASDSVHQRFSSHLPAKTIKLTLLPWLIVLHRPIVWPSWFLSDSRVILQWFRQCFRKCRPSITNYLQVRRFPAESNSLIWIFSNLIELILFHFRAIRCIPFNGWYEMNVHWIVFSKHYPRHSISQYQWIH